MSYSSEFLGSEIQQSMTFADASNLTTDYIISTMENICNARNIPAKFRKDTVVSGKMFSKKTYDCVVVSHPCPPQDYASQIYVLAGNTVLFHFVGNSKAFREKNEYEAVKSGQGTGLQTMKYMFKQPDRVALEQELGWHGQVIDVFNGLVR